MPVHQSQFSVCAGAHFAGVLLEACVWPRRALQQPWPVGGGHTLLSKLLEGALVRESVADASTKIEHFNRTIIAVNKIRFILIFFNLQRSKRPSSAADHEALVTRTDWKCAIW